MFDWILNTPLDIFFFCLGFLSRTFTNHRTAGEGGGYFFNSSLPLPPVSQTLRHQPGDYCCELTSAHRQQPGLNREPLASERKSLTTKLWIPVRIQLTGALIISLDVALVAFLLILNKQWRYRAKQDQLFDNRSILFLSLITKLIKSIKLFDINKMGSK